MNIENTNYNEYGFDDFVFDNSFVSYANNKNPEDVVKWENWLSPVFDTGSPKVK